MYYMAKDPVPLAGEKREAPKVELLPVTEATPQFKDFYVKNIICDGAEKAIFVRGLPEMSIKNINLENLVIQSRKGVDIQEGQNINIRNLKLILQDTKPVINILNSSAVHISELKFNDAELLVSALGERTANIVFKNVNTAKAKQKTEIGTDVKAGAVIVE